MCWTNTNASQRQQLSRGLALVTLEFGVLKKRKAHCVLKESRGTQHGSGHTAGVYHTFDPGKKFQVLSNTPDHLVKGLRLLVRIRNQKLSLGICTFVLC